MMRMRRRYRQPRLQIDVDAIGMGLIYVLGTVVIILAVVYAWKRLG